VSSEGTYCLKGPSINVWNGYYMIFTLSFLVRACFPFFLKNISKWREWRQSIDVNLIVSDTKYRAILDKIYCSLIRCLEKENRMIFLFIFIIIINSFINETIIQIITGKNMMNLKKKLKNYFNIFLNVKRFKKTFCISISSIYCTVDYDLFVFVF
jgi:hypothetical protein